MLTVLARDNGGSRQWLKTAITELGATVRMTRIDGAVWAVLELAPEAAFAFQQLVPWDNGWTIRMTDIGNPDAQTLPGDELHEPWTRGRAALPVPLVAIDASPVL